jgi:predicted RNase H-like HicB family nuclease/predicted RNA binding protein YcfA (HicA-like mRNA interferase family)
VAGGAGIHLRTWIVWKNMTMKRPFAATVWREGNWYVSQCLEVDIASQGESEEEALANLREALALELHFEHPEATRPSQVRTVEVEVGEFKPQPFREIKPRLEAAGFVETSQKGRHVKSVRRLGDVIDTAIVPNKREVPVGTLRSILSQAHIDVDDWDKIE